MGVLSFLMIHGASTYAYGNKANFFEIVKTLRYLMSQWLIDTRLKQGLVRPHPPTWITGGEVVNMGFADDLLPDSVIKRNGSEKDKPLAILYAALQQYDPILTSEER